MSEKKRFCIDYDLEDLENENEKLRAKILEQQNTIERLERRIKFLEKIAEVR